MNKSRDPVRAYLRTIGRKGGQRSRRSLDAQAARRMVAVREARRAFRDYQHEVFWSAPKDLVVREEQVPFIIATMKREGGRAIYERARKIQRLWGAVPCP
ncbi:MAG TPA: hypothetical protein PKC67_12355 [Kiritimatiellia bacterium]|nr:hypothetical protein [Kiritimatiellia bacterium]HMP35131.1 hypothetical protein [Kiritimatiellia bacterium]